MTTFAVLSGLGHALFVALGLLVYVMATRIGHQRRHPSAALSWVLGIVTFPYAAVPLFLLLGTRKFARPQHPPRAKGHAPENPPPEGPGPRWAAQVLASMGLPPAVRNDRVAFHAEGPEALQALLDTVAAAQQQLQVCTFVFGGDAVGQRVAQALMARARQGVAVQVLLDAVGSWRTPRSLLQALADSGVVVRRFMPLWHNPLPGRVNLRNHRKLVVADGQRLWAGGRNLAAEYFLGVGGQPPWIDLSFSAHGLLARQAQAQFRADWHAATGQPATALVHDHRLQGPDQGPPTQWVPSGPDHADDTVHALLLAGAYHAQRRIVAVTPYFVPDDALLDAWCMACRRGVQVCLLLPARSNHRLADWARERALRQLVEAGGQVWLAPRMLHAKAVWIDGEIALVGSLNLDARSLFLNYEAMTAFYGPEALRWLDRWSAAQIAQARPYQARAPSWPREIAEGVVRSVGFQL